MITDIDKYIQCQIGNKNVSSVVIDYLTDPPVLPYLEELIARTCVIHNDLIRCTYYSDFYFHYGEVVYESCCIYPTRNGNWLIVKN